MFFRLQWKKYEQSLMEEENKRILEFAKQQQSREEERMEKRKQAEEAMTKVQEHVSSTTSRDRCQPNSGTRGPGGHLPFPTHIYKYYPLLKA